MSALSTYLADLRRTFATGEAREHAYRPALRNLLQTLEPSVTAVNEPKHREFGAIDFLVLRGEVEVGWVEAKDIGADLNKVEKTEQLKRYLSAFPSLLLTDYLEFRWYVDGQLHHARRLGEVNRGKIQCTLLGGTAVEELLRWFLVFSTPVAATPKSLAVRMASLAQIAKDSILGVLRGETEKGQLHSQMEAFRSTLLPDLNEQQFADMYAQTIAYGLFAARSNNPTSRVFSRRSAAWDLPKTNPFLREMFDEIAGVKLHEDVAWVVDRLAALLASADMAEINKALGKHQVGREDPVVHFYETFLKEYNPKERKIRGVYYTPEPVVSYIVHSVDYLLKTEFDKPLGLADPEVFILDPACGTGTFLYFVIEHIHRTIVEKQGAGAWSGYVEKHLLPRIFGFELLMAPYAIAHLKLGMLLRETGYDFSGDQRLGIYMTNTLEDTKVQTEIHFAQFIAQEANAAADVKREKPIMVVLGNPPYSVSSANRGQWIQGLIEDYKAGLKERKLNLDDDYIKFIRFGQWRIQRTGYGVVGFITNNSYLDGLTHRRMRESLLSTFGSLQICNLHGDSRKGERAPDGGPDENVFDIQQGVAVVLLTRRRPGGNEVTSTDIFGERATKYAWLRENDAASAAADTLAPLAPWFFLTPKDLSLSADWENLVSVRMAFGLSTTGVQTARDGFAVGHDVGELMERLRVFTDASWADDRVRSALGLKDSRGWSLPPARRTFQAEGVGKVPLEQYAYRPFDLRVVMYDKRLIDWPRSELEKHVAGKANLCLLSSRGTLLTETGICLCTRALPDKRLLAGSTGEAKVFPLYLYPSGEELQAEEPRRSNLNPTFVRELEERLGLRFIEDGRGDLGVGLESGTRGSRVGEVADGSEGGGTAATAHSRAANTTTAHGRAAHATFGPENVFAYIYAVLHSPTYRERYAEFLKIDFPRIPLTGDVGLFRRLCALGDELVTLHLMEHPVLEQAPAKLEPAGSNEVEAVRYDEKAQRVYINKAQHFAPVEPEVFAFQIGGYQALNKWLKDRKGRTLSFEDVRHYGKVVVALRETRHLMAEIDGAIPGWPIK